MKIQHLHRAYILGEEASNKKIKKEKTESGSGTCHEEKSKERKWVGRVATTANEAME